LGGRDEGDLVGQVEGEHEEPLLDAVDHHDAARKVRKGAPGGVEVGIVVGGIDVEVPDLAQPGIIAAAIVQDFQHRQPGPVIGLKDEVALCVEVVIDGVGHAHELVDQDRGIQVRDVPDPGLGAVAEISFVELVVEQQVLVVLAQPGLMGVAAAGIASAGNLLRARFVGHVHDRDCVLVGGEADFPTLVIGVGPPIEHALGVVGIAVGVEAAGEGRVRRVDDGCPRCAGRRRRRSAPSR
jgi:hypothetical protein